MIIRGGEVALPGKDLPEAVDIRVTDGKISQIGIGLALAENEECIDVSGTLVLPGCIDPHVHFNDPGFTDREDFSHGTAAAAAGGVTTIIDMPCTSVPPVTSLQHLNEKLEVIGPKARIDYGLYGGVSGSMVPETYQECMRELAGLVCGFKCYLISGMETFPRVDAFQLHAVMCEAADLNIPILLHAEDFEYVYAATQEAILEGCGPIHYYHSRPELAEILGIRSAVALAQETGAQLHIVHVGTARAIECNPGNSVTFETGPHYLAFSHEDFSRIGAPLKTTPPVKSPINKNELWSHLEDGSISFVASDHAPAPDDAKSTGSIWTDYAGIPGTGTLLPYLISEGYLKGRISLSRLCEATSKGAAIRFGLLDRKGSISIGMDADFACIDLQKDWVVKGEDLPSKGNITPFDGMTLHGTISRTILRGKTVYHNGAVTGDEGYGEFLQPAHTGSQNR